MISYIPPVDVVNEKIDHPRIIPQIFHAVVHCEIEGPYYVTIKINTSYAWPIKKNGIIKCKPSSASSPQYFRVMQITSKWDITEITAYHISYDMSNKVIGRMYGIESLSSLLNSINSKMLTPQPFRFKTYGDVGNKKIYIDRKEPSSLKSILGGADDSILSQTQCHIMYDNYTVEIWDNYALGSPTNAVYGLNIGDDTKGLIDTTEYFTDILPYYISEDGALIMLPEKTLKAPYVSSYDGTYVATKIVDLTDAFDTVPTEDQLRDQANLWLVLYSNEQIASVNIAMLPVDNWGSPFSGFIYDRVYVSVPWLNMKHTELRCVSTDYDVLTDRYVDIRIGSINPTISETVALTLTDIEQLKKKNR